nr:hypothetical protein [Mixta theicola]
MYELNEIHKQLVSGGASDVDAGWNIITTLPGIINDGSSVVADIDPGFTWPSCGVAVPPIELLPYPPCCCRPVPPIFVFPDFPSVIAPL